MGNKFWKGAAVAIALELLIAALVLWLLHAVHVNVTVQLGMVIGFTAYWISSAWQKGRTDRNADTAAALARGTGTYIIGDKVLHKNMKPIGERLGVPLAGVQPGAVPRDPVTGAELFVGERDRDADVAKINEHLDAAHRALRGQ